MKFTLTKEIELNGNMVSELEIDLDSLSVKDLSEAKTEWMRAGGFSPMPTLDMDFNMRCVAKALNVPFEDLQSMSGKDYMRLSQEVTGFFLK